jgi:hypothetical protein
VPFGKVAVLLGLGWRVLADEGIVVGACDGWDVGSVDEISTVVNSVVAALVTCVEEDCSAAMLMGEDWALRKGDTAAATAEVLIWADSAVWVDRGTEDADEKGTTIDCEVERLGAVDVAAIGMDVWIVSEDAVVVCAFGDGVDGLRVDAAIGTSSVSVTVTIIIAALSVTVTVMYCPPPELGDDLGVEVPVDIVPGADGEVTEPAEIV